MEKIIDKISNYHIFNYIIPGGLFLILCNNYLNIKIEQDKITYFFFISYFIGIIISRVSSLVTEKILCYIFKIKKENYDNYIAAAKKDENIEVLMQDMNMYRSICTMLIILLIIKVAKIFRLYQLIDKDLLILLVFISLIIIFICAYIKQNKYVVSRVKIANKKK